MEVPVFHNPCGHRTTERPCDCTQSVEALERLERMLEAQQRFFTTEPVMVPPGDLRIAIKLARKAVERG